MFGLPEHFCKEAHQVWLEKFRMSGKQSKMKTDFEMFEVLQIYGSSMLKKMISFLLEQNSPVVIKKNLKNNCNTNCMIYLQM